MKRLGIVENIVYDGTVLVRSAFVPDPGSAIVDRRGRPVGSVARTFGPVHEPFVVLRATSPVSASVIGTEVFLGEGKHASEKDRRGRRGH